MKGGELFLKNPLKTLLLVSVTEVLKEIISKQQKSFWGVSTATWYTYEYQSKVMYLITCPPYVKGIR